jgi:alpha-beta hydrolase superfamily lysophospholipase
MKPATIALLPKLETQCGSALGATFSAIAGGPGTTDPLKLADWGPFVRSNDAGQAAIGAPVLVLQGDKDGTVPKAINDGYTADACKQRDTVQYSVWPGDSHESIVKGHALEEAIGWMVDRVAGRTAPSNCVAGK